MGDIPSYSNPICENCGLCIDAKNPFMPALSFRDNEPPEPGCVLVVGEYPSPKEDHSGVPFSPKDQTGKWLRTRLEENGIADDVAFTQAVRCRPKTKLTSKTPVKACRPFLLQEIEDLRPKAILMLGNKALYSLTGREGITKRRRQMMTHVLKDGTEIPIMAGFSPAAILYDMNNLPDFNKDVDTFANMVKGKVVDAGKIEEDLLGKFNQNASAADIKRLHRKLLANPELVLSFDAETNGLYPYLIGKDFRVTMLSFSDGEETLIARLDNVEGKIELRDRRLLDECLALLQDKNVRKVAHNAKYDMHAVWVRFKKLVNNIVCDTMLLHAMLRPVNTSHKLEDLSMDLLGVTAYHESTSKKGKKKGKKTQDAWLSMADDEELVRRAGLDAACTHRLYETLWKKALEENDKFDDLGIHGFHITDVFSQITMPCMYTLFRMERNGFPVDLKIAERLETEYKTKIDRLATSLSNMSKVKAYLEQMREEYLASSKAPKTKHLAEARAAALSFNAKGPAQVAGVLHHHYGIPEKLFNKTTGGALSADKETLVRIKDSKYYSKCKKFITRVLLYRHLIKGHGTYLKGVITRLSKDGRIHATFRQDVAKTGRLCISGDTYLHTTHGAVTIRELDLHKMQNVSIRTHTGAWKRILHKFIKGEELMYEVELENGSKIRCTAGHRVLRRDGSWVGVRTLEPGDGVYSKVDSRSIQREKREDCPMLYSGPGNVYGAIHRRWKEPKRDSQNIGLLTPSDKPYPSSLSNNRRAKDARGEEQELQKRNIRKHTWEAGETQNSNTVRRPGDTLGPRVSCVAYSNSLQHVRVPSKGEYPALWPCQKEIPTKCFSHTAESLNKSATPIPRNKTGYGNVHKGPEELYRNSVQSTIQSAPSYTRYSKAWACNVFCIPKGQEIRWKVSREAQPCHMEPKYSRDEAIQRPTKSWDFASTVVDLSEDMGNNELLRGYYDSPMEDGGRSRWGIPHTQQTDYETRRREDARTGRERVHDYPSKQKNGGERAPNVSSDYSISKVRRIRSVGVELVYDIEVEDDHSYVAGGFVNHNSSSNPNLQNLSKKHLDIRSMFVAPEGWSIVEADYSQIELRVLAAESGDEVLVNTFIDGRDLHDETARDVWKIPQGVEVSDEVRVAAKRTNFGIVYLISKWGLQRQIGGTEDECQERIDGVYKRMPGVKKWQDRTGRFARKTGRVYSLFGHWRDVKNASFKPVRGESEGWSAYMGAIRQAVNAPIQGAAGMIMFVSVNKLDRLIRKNKLTDRVQIVNTIHDSLMLLVKDDMLPKVIDMARKVMETEPTRWLGDALRGVPIKVDIKVGKTWASMEKLAA